MSCDRVIHPPAVESPEEGEEDFLDVAIDQTNDWSSAVRASPEVLNAMAHFWEVLPPCDPIIPFPFSLPYAACRRLGA